MSYDPNGEKEEIIGEEEITDDGEEEITEDAEEEITEGAEEKASVTEAAAGNIEAYKAEVYSAAEDKKEENIPQESSAEENKISKGKNAGAAPERVLPDVVPAESFSVEEKNAAAGSLFTQDTAADDVLEAVNEAMQLEIDETEPETWAESSESIAELPDEGAFTEELIEDIVSDEDEAEDSAAPAEISGSEDIRPDENTAASEKTSGSPAEPEEASPEKEKKSFIRSIIPCKGDSVFEIVRKIIFISAVTVFIIAGIMLARTLIDSKKAKQDAQDIKNKVTTAAVTSINEDGSVVVIEPTEEDEIKHNIDVMQYYKDISENVIGFIELEGCDLYQPVVQGTDNDYYLTHTYYDDVNKGGAVFADYRCIIEEDHCSPNIVLYGHNQEDGTMFGNLKDYKQNTAFYAANPTVTFNTEYGIGTYLIYGYFITNALESQDSSGEVFHYHDYIETMNDEATFNWYMNEVQRRNQIVSPVDVEFGDQLLCLSTCSNEFSNSRFVVFARKLRDGESAADFDFTKAYLNPNAKGVDWEAIISGEISETIPEETTHKALKTRRTGTEEDEDGGKTKKTKKTAEAENGAETVKTKKTRPASTEAPVTESEPPETVTAGANAQ